MRLAFILVKLRPEIICSVEQLCLAGMRARRIYDQESERVLELYQGTLRSYLWCSSAADIVAGLL